MKNCILIVGLGSIGQRHLGLCRELFPSYKIIVLHHEQCNLKDCSADFCTNSLNEAVNLKPQFAIICNPAVFHKSVSMKLARNGIHLLIEKPICDNLKDARQVLEVAKENNIILQVGYNLRYLESLKKFKNEIWSDSIGRITSVQSDVGQFLPDWRPKSNWRKSVSANLNFGGGALLELSHELDYLTWIFGSVSNVTGIMSKQSNFGLDVEDTVNAILEFECCTPKGAKGSPVIAAVTLDFVRRTSTRYCVARGEKGTLKWDAIKSKVILEKPDGSSKILFRSKPDKNFSYLEQLKCFKYLIKNKNKSSLDLNNGLAALSIVEAIRSSSEAGGAKYSPKYMLGN